jgi:hypothetical protein
MSQENWWNREPDPFDEPPLCANCEHDARDHFQGCGPCRVCGCVEYNPDGPPEPENE